ncbi:hypothetical protein GCM10008927_12590 [Amylibacter ulvae]|uniref:Tetrapyrrole biosynthesis uroporphyrinogen III synthase domain-containing protein n=1 Tax=Paramylibacter ulvae TaxID=1651968 RepID=A0ABQ3D076_9RHOB|nr:uroporphyrinogen-III synthase [Amylibacter ulvae]GHA48924.1 hypothetical protein GCM10008927_12590 [Amylibacter ulvae]
MPQPKPILIMTRPSGQARDFVDSLRRNCDDVTVHYAPLVEIEFLPIKLPAPKNRIFAFTSANGVDAYLRNHRPVGNHAYCVNDATAARARAAGFFVTQGSGDGAALAGMITEGPVVYIHGEQISFDLGENLDRRGIECETFAAYRQISLDLDQICTKIIQTEQCVIPVFSTNSAQVLHSQLRHIQPRHLILPCISNQVAQIFDDMSYIQIEVASKPNRAGMLTVVSGAYTAGK